jgi:hypothetical protein
LATCFEQFLAAIPNSWVYRAGGVFAFVSGIPIPILNGVWTEGIEANETEIARQLDRVAGSCLPYCFQRRPCAPQALATVASERGMVRTPREGTLDGDVPLMVVEEAGRLSAVQRLGDLTIRELDPGDAAIQAELAALGFGIPRDVFDKLATPAILQLPSVRCYVGYAGGVAVTTGMGTTIGPFVGIFNIATPAGHRRNGYGAAITARAVADGFAHGARWALLQASAEGYGVYERLGFTTLEYWDSWTALPPP